MKRYYEFDLPIPGLQRVRFVVHRQDLSANGDLESGILQGVQRLKRHDPNLGIGEVLQRSLEDPETRILVVVRNPALVLDQQLPERVAKALDALPADPDWSLAAAGGLGPADQRYMSLYASAKPTLPSTSGPRPLLDLMPDLYLVNADFARQILAAAPKPIDAALEPILATEGYLAGRVAVYLPQLAAGIDGDLQHRDLDALSRELNNHFGHRLPRQSIATLAGAINLPDAPAGQFDSAGAPHLPGQRLVTEAVNSTLARHSEILALSIVVRTRFDRVHLLERLLASISRNDRTGIELEVILSTDVEPSLANTAFQDLQQSFCNLHLSLQQNETAVHSRVSNMVGGLKAARHAYVMLIDDDDYVDLFAFETLSDALFMGNRPLIVTASEVHDEVWESTPSGRWVVTQSSSRQKYPADGWRSLFGGANTLPICALIMPRDQLLARLETFTFNHDLSEDYALFLLIFTDPQLPAVFEVPQTFSHISLRGAENTVTMKDRRPWVSNICGYLADLAATPAVAGPGLWALLCSDAARSETVIDAKSVSDLRSALDRAQSNIDLLRQENERLRRQRKLNNETAL